MQPTSGLFITLVVIVAVACLLVTVVSVPRLWRRGFLKYLVQGVSVVLTTLLLLLAVGVYLNAENNWFPTWGSLTSSPADQPVSQESYGKENALNPDVVAKTTAVPTKLQASPHENPVFGKDLPKDTSNGAYATFSVKGVASGETHSVMAWFPASYFENSDRFYPVIVGFPGFPGSPKSYSNDLNYGQLIQDAVTKSEMQDAILVIPDVSPGTYDSECVDGTGGENPPHVETYVTQDLVPWIKENMRTIDSPQAWATSGYSAGGWCSSMLAIRHPHIFGAALNQSGYFSPIYSENQQWNAQDDSRYDLSKIVQKQRPDVHIYFFASEDDPLAMDGLAGFPSSVDPPTYLTIETIPVGGHRPDVWRVGIAAGLEHLGQDLKYFAPVS